MILEMLFFDTWLGNSSIFGILVTISQGPSAIRAKPVGRRLRWRREEHLLKPLRCP